MGVTDRYSNHALQIHTLDMASAVNLGLLNSLSHEPNSEVARPQAGSVFPLNQLILSQRPQIPFGTEAIRSLLDTVGVTGKCIDSDGTHPGVVAFGESHNNCSSTARGGAGTHLSLTAGQGHLSLTGLSASAGSFVQATGIVYGVTADGDTYPFTPAYNANLPASRIVDELYHLGKAQVLGSTVERITNVSMDLSPSIELSNDADSIWASLIDVQEVPVVTTITTEDPKWLDPATKIRFNGNKTTASDTYVNFLALETSTTAAVSGGAFKDFTGNHHIKGTLTGLVHVTQHYNASGTAVSSTTIQIASIEMSGVAPVVWDTAAAYSL